MELLLNTFGQIISDEKLGDTILKRIRQMLAGNEQVTIDFYGIKSMATYNAKQIFGQLYIDLGPEAFFKKIAIKNASENVLTIIRMGIQDSLRVAAAAAK